MNNFSLSDFGGRFPNPLRWLPAPQVLAGPLRLVIRPRLQAYVLQRMINESLGVLMKDGALDPLDGRRVGIAVTDLGLQWVLAIGNRCIHVFPGNSKAEATIQGSATDLLLLASRLEDADTLFFQRRLQLTGDTELGLTARNLLDQIPWDTLPRHLRVALERTARIARFARSARSDAPH